jgi:hypothetical protein
VSVPPTENVIYIGNNSVNAIQVMDFLSSYIQALFDNDFQLEDIALPVISHNHVNSSMVPTNTSINSQVRNVNEYNYSAGPNVLSTKFNAKYFKQQLHCQFSFLFKMRKNTSA